MSVVIRFPGGPNTTLSESDAWNEYLLAVAELHAAFPNVNVSHCRRVVDTYDRFCFAMKARPRNV